MNIKIKINKISMAIKKLIKPIEVFGAEHGKVFQQTSHGKLEKSYLVGTGINDTPIAIWYDDESKKYRLSGDNSKASLKQYLSHIKYQEINASITISLNIKD